MLKKNHAFSYNLNFFFLIIHIYIYIYLLVYRMYIGKLKCRALLQTQASKIAL